jgi:hypothetical protein
LSISTSSQASRSSGRGRDVDPIERIVGVAENYNSSDATDFGFFLNHGAPPFAGDITFQMEVSGTAVPEPSTWAMMLAGFAGLGLLGWSASRATHSA